MTDRGSTGPVIYIDRSDVHEDRWGELKAGIQALVTFVDSHQPQMATRGFYLDEDARQMTVVSVHPDSASLERHVEIGGPQFKKLAPFLTLREIEVFGHLSEKAVELVRAKAATLGDGGLVTCTSGSQGSTASTAAAAGRRRRAASRSMSSRLAHTAVSGPSSPGRRARACASGAVPAPVGVHRARLARSASPGSCAETTSFTREGSCLSCRARSAAARTVPSVLEKGSPVGRGEELQIVVDARGASGTSGVVPAWSAGAGKTGLTEHRGGDG